MCRSTLLALHPLTDGLMNTQDLSDLHLKDRLLSIQNRVRERFKGQPQAARSKLKLRRSKDFAYEWDHWDTDKVVQAGCCLLTPAQPARLEQA